MIIYTVYVQVKKVQDSNWNADLINGDTHNQVITIDILHFFKYRFCMFHNKVINRFLINVGGK